MRRASYEGVAFCLYISQTNSLLCFQEHLVQRLFATPGSRTGITLLCISTAVQGFLMFSLEFHYWSGAEVLRDLVGLVRVVCVRMVSTSGKILSVDWRHYFDSLYRRGSRYFAKADPIKAEYGGLIMGLVAARDAGIRNLTFYGDSDEVIDHMLVNTCFCQRPSVSCIISTLGQTRYQFQCY